MYIYTVYTVPGGISEDFECWAYCIPQAVRDRIVIIKKKNI